MSQYPRLCCQYKKCAQPEAVRMKNASPIVAKQNYTRYTTMVCKVGLRFYLSKKTNHRSIIKEYLVLFGTFIVTQAGKSVNKNSIGMHAKLIWSYRIRL